MCKWHTCDLGQSIVATLDSFETDLTIDIVESNFISSVDLNVNDAPPNDGIADDEYIDGNEKDFYDTILIELFSWWSL